MKSILLLVAIVAVSSANIITILNNCSPITIWPALLNNPGQPLPANGGFQLNVGQSIDITVPSNWAGRIWARTNCDASGHCETGDCGNGIQCDGAGGVPPASLAEITMDGAGGLDFYDVSLVDGYNLPISMSPIGSYTKQGTGTIYDCGTAGCNKDLNAICPAELSVKNSDGYTVACMSACMKFNTDQYCCRGAYGTPATCNSSNWPTNYPAIFKQACPNAYSYAYDDSTSTFTCQSSMYQVTFCP